MAKVYEFLANGFEEVEALHLSPQSIHILPTLLSPYNAQKRSIYVNNAIVSCG